MENTKNIYYNKYLKYKNKYLKLKGGAIISIIESFLLPDELQFLGAGVIGVVYLDRNINSAIKINKNYVRDELINFIQIDDIKSEIIYNNISSQENFDEYFSTLKLLDDSQENDRSKAYLKNMFDKYFEHLQILNSLTTFLKFTGITIYRNIGMNRIHYVEKPLIVPTFEFLVEENISAVTNIKESMINIIKDMKTYNMNGYIHGDLQNMCRNIIAYKDTSGDIKLKVIDVDNPNKILNDKLSLDHSFKRLFIDYVSLLNCLNHYRLLDSDTIDRLLNIDLFELIKSLDLTKFYIIDTTTYSSSNDYPIYNIKLSNWESNYINGTYFAHSFELSKLESPDSSVPRPKLLRMDSVGSSMKIIIVNSILKHFDVDIQFPSCRYCILQYKASNDENIIKFYEKIYDDLLSSLH